MKVQKKSGSKKPSQASLELKYKDIMALFSVADDLISAAENAQDPIQYIEEVEPLVDEVVVTADTLSEEFFVIINGKKAGQKTSKTRIEASLRKSYTALSRFAKTASVATRKHAENLMAKLQQQLEAVIASVIEFVALSLDRIMHKAEIESLKLRQVHVAHLLHGMSQQVAT
jgi:hypothetical protein